MSAYLIGTPRLKSPKKISPLLRAPKHEILIHCFNFFLNLTNCPQISVISVISVIFVISVISEISVISSIVSILSEKLNKYLENYAQPRLKKGVLIKKVEKEFLRLSLPANSNA